MATETVTVLLYSMANNKSPFEEWVKRLKDRKARAKINVRINRVRLGNFGDRRSVGDGIFELKIDYGPGYRIYYAHVEKDTVVLLLCGGDKNTQDQDIEKAKEYWHDYKSYVEDGG